MFLFVREFQSLKTETNSLLFPFSKMRDKTKNKVSLLQKDQLLPPKDYFKGGSMSLLLVFLGFGFSLS